MNALTDAPTLTSRCKVCGAVSRLFVTVDASKHCNMQLPPVLPPSGVAVDYFKCESCEFLFSTYLDAWSKDDVCRFIYNDDYVNFDPLYPRIRPEINARFLGRILSEAWLGGDDVRVLDYGAGSGLLSRLLQSKIVVDNYDAMNPDFDQLPTARYDIIFCAEVVEHIPFPKNFARDWAGLLSDGGAVVFSTKILPDDIDQQKAEWWYLGPRNGHVSLYSERSLSILLEQAGLRYECLSEDWHVALHGEASRLDLQMVRQLVDMQPKGFIEI